MKTSEYQPTFFNKRGSPARVSVSLSRCSKATTPFSFYSTAGYWKWSDALTLLFPVGQVTGFYVFFHYFTPQKEVAEAALPRKKWQIPTATMVRKERKMQIQMA